MAAKHRCEIQETMETDATAVAVMTDIWMSLVNGPYISLTASYITPAWTMRKPTLIDTLIDKRHMQANITARLSEITTDWRLSEKVVAVVHDVAANMRDCGSGNGWTDVDCSAHKIHLSVLAAMGIDKVSVSHYISPIISCVKKQNSMQLWLSLITALGYDLYLMFCVAYWTSFRIYRLCVLCLACCADDS